MLIYERLAPAVAPSVPLVRHEVGDAFSEWDLLGERRADALPALSEAATNVVLHAYRDGRPGPLYTAATVDGGAVTLWVVDNGRGLSARSDSPGAGMGLRLLAVLSDELRVQGGTSEAGTCITATFRARPREPAFVAAPGKVAAVQTRAQLLVGYAELLAQSNADLREEMRALRAEGRRVLLQARPRRRRNPV